MISPWGYAAPGRAGVLPLAPVLPRGLLRVTLRGMSIRMKEWGMLASPGQPVHVRTQGLYGWERVGRAVGQGFADVLEGGAALMGLEKVKQAGELASFSEQLKSISAEVGEELREQEVKDWDYSWNAAVSPRLNEAVQGLSAESRAAGMELARMYSAQASIEARRDRDMQRVSSARERWQQQVEASVSAGQQEQAARWLEAGRGVFVPEGQMEGRLQEVRSRACHARWETRLQTNPLEALRDMSVAREGESGGWPEREDERRRLEQSCARTRRELRRELARGFSERIRAGEDVEPAILELAAGAGVIPALSREAGCTQAPPATATRMAWRRWLDSRADGEESETDARLTIATALLPLEERRMLLARLERMSGVPAADRRALSEQLFSLYHSGALGCPGDAEAEQALLSLQEEGGSLLAEQGAAAVADWVQAHRAGADGWVCFEAEKSRRMK